MSNGKPGQGEKPPSLFLSVPGHPLDNLSFKRLTPATPQYQQRHETRAQVSADKLLMACWRTADHVPVVRL